MLPMTLIISLFIYSTVYGFLEYAEWPSKIHTCILNEYCSFNCTYTTNNFYLEYIHYNNKTADELYNDYNNGKAPFLLHYPFFYQKSINKDKNLITIFFNATLPGYFLYRSAATAIKWNTEFVAIFVSYPPPDPSIIIQNCNYITTQLYSKIIYNNENIKYDYQFLILILTCASLTTIICFTILLSYIVIKKRFQNNSRSFK